MEPMGKVGGDDLQALVDGLGISESERECLTPKWENVRGGNPLIRAIKYAGRGIYVAFRRIFSDAGTDNERQLTKLSSNIRKIHRLVRDGNSGINGQSLLATITKVNEALRELEGFGARAPSMQEVRLDLYPDFRDFHDVVELGLSGNQVKIVV